MSCKLRVLNRSMGFVHRRICSKYFPRLLRGIFTIDNFYPLSRPTWRRMPTRCSSCSNPGGLLPSWPSSGRLGRMSSRWLTRTAQQWRSWKREELGEIAPHRGAPSACTSCASFLLRHACTMCVSKHRQTPCRGFGAP